VILATLFILGRAMRIPIRITGVDQLPTFNRSDRLAMGRIPIKVRGSHEFGLPAIEVRGVNDPSISDPKPTDYSGATYFEDVESEGPDIVATLHDPQGTYDDTEIHVKRELYCSAQRFYMVRK